MRGRERVALLAPRLRRYARAIAGSAAVADSCVEAAILHFRKEPPWPADAETKLYRLVYLELRAVAERRSSRQSPALVDLDNLEHGLDALGAAERHILVLGALERLEATEIAAVMALPVDEVERRRDAAYASLEGRAGRVLIVHRDEMFARELEHEVRIAGHEVVGVAPDARMAMRLFGDARAGLIYTALTEASDELTSQAVAAVRSLVDVGRVVVSTSSDAASTGLAELPLVIVRRPSDPLLLRLVMAQSHTGAGAEVKAAG